MWATIITMIKEAWHLAHSSGRNYRTHSQVVQMGHRPSVLDFRTTRSDGLSSTEAVSVAWMLVTCDLQAKFEPQQGVANKALIVEVKKKHCPAQMRESSISIQTSILRNHAQVSDNKKKC
ncbi:hypothetical protein TNCT_338171 [Trichonephila clavata]|uniref:Uncharacterized protein n=1 Tax=Trichonephila clavata TaxID=2740835 RepID=A0A8X6FU84_TRICU|nr:hypothetical protein TNCT_338171 [Trichonephila clavata]